MQNNQAKSKTNQSSLNVLNDLHAIMTHLPIVLRDRICEECNWSIPTYYRKCRAGVKGEKAYSKAEEQMIVKVYMETLKGAFDHIDKYKNIQPAS
ncbi:hypothetical protein SAMN05428949_5669 [Chitinophaga sp. YR627]|uniref:hypothetical protein n=1 Tax=Chitinophaga sp. YR627 TaxID=1881041 RepID=UPI0008EC9524|nr:hypothetical protein [Chitinophaga sp. YR627]SFO54342.1 hypothetical protein SAMN05428949_5669 [Chitinophaga sp. YR627]